MKHATLFGILLLLFCLVLTSCTTLFGKKQSNSLPLTKATNVSSTTTVETSSMTAISSRPSNAPVTSASISSSSSSRVSVDMNAQIEGFYMPKEYIMLVGEKRQFPASLIPTHARGRDDVIIKIDDPSIAKSTSDRGSSFMIEGLAQGTCTLTLTAPNGVTGTTKIIVK